jgi:hypothetical protein
MEFEDLERYLDRHRGDESPTFCFYCRSLDLIALPENTAPGHAGPRCLSCNTIWVRAFTSDCPECGPSGGWVHLHAPSHLDHEQRRVVRAAGLAWCDACWLPWVYEWNLRRGEPFLNLAGLRRGAVPPLVSHTLDARKSIQTDS